MRKKIIAGNWKMNLNSIEAVSLTENILKLLSDKDSIHIILSPSFISLQEINKMCVGFDKVNIAAQDISKLEEGAFTGEVSASMISSLGVDYTIIGHSERREYLQENNHHIKKKVDLAIKHNLEIIFCCGENLDQRENNLHFDWIESQISQSLFHLQEKEFSSVIVAYEPIWAIGTGVTASCDQAEKMHKFIRDIICKRYGDETADNTSILYGGSCNPSNSKDLFSKSNIDGGLIGSASLNAEVFVEIIKSF